MKRRRQKGGIPALIATLVSALAITGAIWVLSDSPDDFARTMRDMTGLGGFFSGESPGSGASTPFSQAAPVPDGSVRVHIIDVGQALCVLIQGENQSVLIDGGENDTSAATAQYLRSQGVDQLDLVFNSHPHYDHFGGLRGILEEIPAQKYFTPDLPEDQVPTLVSYEKLLAFLAEEGIPMEPASVGAQYDLGGALLTVLGPQGQYDDMNNWSIVLRLDCGERSFLIPGDIENKAERDLLEAGVPLKSDVLILPHHGSNSSILQDFVREVDPQYGVISCGKDNDYGHPHQETLELYGKLATQLLRTDKLGTIVFETDGETLEYYTWLPDAA